MSPPEQDWRDPAVDGEDLQLTFATGAHSHSIESVLDLDPEGFVVGIEILGVILASRVNRSPSEGDMKRAGTLSVSIDPEADAMYIRLMEGTSAHQVVRPAVVTVAEDGSLAGIRVLSGA
jgi:uncharacterized protein YuzE